jgi:Fe-S cluster biogenesis protein NfuA
MDRTEVYRKINMGLDQIRPFLQEDGGDISLVEVSEDMVVRVRLTGACGNCAMRVQTLKAGVESTLKRMIPEIREVVNVADERSSFF